MPLTLLCEFILQEIVSYISHSLEEKKLLYFGMESLDFNFIDPVGVEPVVSHSYLHHLIISVSKMNASHITFSFLLIPIAHRISGLQKMLYQNHCETPGGKKKQDELFNTVYTCR